ncbi:hypothetical protein B0H13DRAFT_1908877 [Mycena leptocephala]|nr:hypothetical protein B0H13DRAFT_1908877 [Mycena leptocephala]
MVSAHLRTADVWGSRDREKAYHRNTPHQLGHPQTFQRGNSGSEQDRQIRFCWTLGKQRQDRGKDQAALILESRARDHVATGRVPVWALNHGAKQSVRTSSKVCVRTAHCSVPPLCCTTPINVDISINAAPKKPNNFIYCAGVCRGDVDRDMVPTRTTRYLSLPQPAPLPPAMQHHRHTEPMRLMLRHRNNDAMRQYA